MTQRTRVVGRGGQGPTWALWTYRAVLVVTLVSIPIGPALAQLRAA